MACRISELVLACHDPEGLARFWCEVLDFIVLDREECAIEIGPREGFGGPQPTIILSRRRAEERETPAPHRRQRHRPRSGRRTRTPPEARGAPGRHRPDGEESWHVLADP